MGNWKFKLSYKTRIYSLIYWIKMLVSCIGIKKADCKIWSKLETRFLLLSWSSLAIFTRWCIPLNTSENYCRVQPDPVMFLFKLFSLSILTCFAVLSEYVADEVLTYEEVALLRPDLQRKRPVVLIGMQKLSIMRWVLHFVS